MDGRTSETVCICTGPCCALTEDGTSKSNGKCSAPCGANCYEPDRWCGWVTIEEDTSRDTCPTKCYNTNVACILYHLN